MAKMLKDFYLSNTEQEGVFDEIMSFNGDLQEAGIEVCAALGKKFNSVEELERLTVENVKAEMDDVLTAEREKYESRMFCDDDYLLQMEQRHAILLKEWTPLIYKLRSKLEKVKSYGCGIKLDSSGRLWIDEASAKQAAKDRAMVHWTEKDKMLYTKLGELVDVVNELRKITPMNYSYLLKFILPERKEPEHGAILGELKTLELTPAKYYNLKKANLGMIPDGIFAKIEDAIL